VSETPTWVTLGPVSGWLLRGSVPASVLPGGDFWSRAARVAVQAAGLRVDTVHTYSRIISVGPFGANPVDGTLAALLVGVPRDVLVECCGAMAVTAGIGLAERPGPMLTRGFGAATERELLAAFVGGSDADTWSESQKGRALGWTVSFGAMLRHPGAHRALAETGATAVRSVLTPALGSALAWEGAVPPRSREFAQASACALALAMVSPKGAQAVARACGPSAAAMLDALGRGGAWPAEFGALAPRLRAALDAETWA